MDALKKFKSWYGQHLPQIKADYFRFLKKRRIDFKKFKDKDDWKDGLSKELGKKFEVIF